MLRRDDEAVPGLGTQGLTAIGGDARGCDRKHGKQDCRRAAGETVWSGHGDTPDEFCESN